MAHVVIRVGTTVTTNDRFAEVVVDGVDVAPQIMADGFGVVLATSPDEESVVTLPVAADAVEIDLPDAVIHALKMSDDPDDPDGGGSSFGAAIERQSRLVERLERSIHEFGNAVRRGAAEGVRTGAQRQRK